MAETITAVVTVEKVQTMVDGAIRLTLDMPQTAVLQMSQFAICKNEGVALEAVFVPKVNEVIGGRLKDG